MENLDPSTIYYVRAYAMTKDYAVGYGEVKKVITLPAGKVKWTYDYGADAAANERIATAVEDAVNYLNTYTSINGLTTQVHYGSGTPTADCSYGGWMRVGPNASYQRTGTILHELGHAIGVGTHSIWNDGNSPMRAGSGRGDWLGDRATEVLRFLDNSSTAVMTGDGTHMWPYGVNGAHEDNGQPILSCSEHLVAWHHPQGGFQSSMWPAIIYRVVPITSLTSSPITSPSLPLPQSTDLLAIPPTCWTHPALGPLHLLFSPPRRFMPQSSAGLPLSLLSCLLISDAFSHHPTEK